MEKYLTEGIWEKLTGTKDSVGFSFDDAIRSGLTHKDSSVGVYAGSHDSYRAFAPLFD